MFSYLLLPFIHQINFDRLLIMKIKMNYIIIYFFILNPIIFILGAKILSALNWILEQSFMNISANSFHLLAVDPLVIAYKNMLAI